MLSYLSDLLPAFLKLFPIFSLGSTSVGIRQPIVLPSRLSAALCLRWVDQTGQWLILLWFFPNHHCQPFTWTPILPILCLWACCLLNAPLLPLQEEEEVGSHRLPGHFSLTLPFFLFFLSFYFFSFSLSSFLYHCHHHKVVFWKWPRRVCGTWQVCLDNSGFARIAYYLLLWTNIDQFQDFHTQDRTRCNGSI